MDSGRGADGSVRAGSGRGCCGTSSEGNGSTMGLSSSSPGLTGQRVW